MTANEFRLVNYVNEKWYNTTKGKYEYSKIQINSIYQTHIVCQDDGAYNLEDIFPIELTEEILLKCGFVKCGVMADLILNISYNRILCYNNDQETINIAQHTGGFKNLRDVHLNKIKHLHQLQNIYFSLTGEELEIKL